jgi:hypothetical protein
MAAIRHALGQWQMRLLSAAGYVSSLFPARMVPLFNRFLLAPIFNGLAGGTVFIEEGASGVVLDAHPDRYQEGEWSLPRSNFSVVRCMLLKRVRSGL